MRVSNLFFLFWGSVVLLQECSSVEGGKLRPHQLKSNHDVERAFLEALEHETPLFKCSAFAEGIPYRLPIKPDCALPNMTAPSTPIIITQYWPDPELVPIEAWECWKESQTIQVRTSWTNIPIFTRGQIEYHYMSKSTCEDLYNSKTTPGGDRLENLNDGLLGTKDERDPDPSYFGLHELTRINFMLSKVLLTVDNKNQEIRPVGATLKKPCRANQGTCETHRGQLRWKKEDHSPCRLKIEKPTDCFELDKNIVCPDPSRVLMKYKTVQMCGITMAKSLQGVLFSSSVAGEVLPSVASSREIVEEIKRINYGRLVLVDKNRKKREAGDYSNDSWGDDDIGHVSRTEFEANFQWLYEIIKQGLNGILHEMYISLCYANVMTLNLAEHQANMGDATAVIRTLTGDPSLRGTMSGDVINVWKCEEITTYMFLERTNCTLEWPILYWSGKEKYQGYLSPLSKELVDTPTEIPCPPPNYYFEAKSNLVDLGNKTVSTWLDYLPNPGGRNNYSYLPEITFNPGGVYRANEVSGRSKLLDILYSLSSKSQVDRGVARIQKGEKPRDSERSALDEVKKYSIEGIENKVYLVTCVVCFIAVGMLTIMFTVYFEKFQTIWKIVVAFGALLGGCFAGCFVACKNGKERLIAKRNVKIATEEKREKSGADDKNKEVVIQIDEESAMPQLEIDSKKG